MRYLILSFIAFLIFNDTIFSQVSLNKELTIENSCVVGNDGVIVLRAKCQKNYIETRYHWIINNVSTQYTGDSIIIYSQSFDDAENIEVKCMFIGEDYFETDTLFESITLDINLDYESETSIYAEFNSNKLKLFVDEPLSSTIYTWKYEDFEKRGTSVQFVYNDLNNIELLETSLATCNTAKRIFRPNFKDTIIPKPNELRIAKVFDGLTEMPTLGSMDQHEVDLKIKDTYTKIKSYYSTNRNVIKGNKFGNKTTNSIVYGYVDVSIPSSKYHTKGSMESPKWWKLELRSDPNKHVHVHERKILDKKTFIDSLNKVDNLTNTALVFIHGYNVEFMEAVKRGAQLSHDINFKGKTISFSWPSKGKISKYLSDTESIQVSKHLFKEFVETIIQESNLEKIHFIAHSMGSRALTFLIEDFLGDKPEYKDKIGELVFCAPDISQIEFKRVIENTEERSQIITLYASSDDLALKASKFFNGYNRAGEGAEKLMILNKVESIDATGIDSGILRHSYHTTVKEILNDLYTLINLKKRAFERTFNLNEVIEPRGKYWNFIK